MFAKEDAQCDAIYWTSKRQGYTCSIARCSENALKTYQQELHDLVIIDARTPKLIDHENLCRSVSRARASRRLATKRAAQNDCHNLLVSL